MQYFSKRNTSLRMWRQSSEFLQKYQARQSLLIWTRDFEEKSSIIKRSQTSPEIWYVLCFIVIALQRPQTFLALTFKLINLFIPRVNYGDM